MQEEGRAFVHLVTNGEMYEATQYSRFSYSGSGTMERK